MNFNATFIVSAISFIIFVFLMNIIFYKPLEEIISKRDKLVDDTLNEAEALRNEADNLLKDREIKLSDTKTKCRNLIKENTEKANLNARNTIQDAKVKSADKLNTKKYELINEKNAVQSQIENIIENLANNITSKILG